MRDKIVEQVLAKYQERSDRGFQKYGTTLQENNKDSYLKHLQEELMDATLYLEKLMTLEREVRDLVRKHQTNNELGEAIRMLVN
jgi:signal recognition particle GTPase